MAQWMEQYHGEFCIVRKTGPILSPLMGLTYARAAGRQADKVRVGFKIFKILYMFNYSGFY